MSDLETADCRTVHSSLLVTAALLSPTHVFPINDSVHPALAIPVGQSKSLLVSGERVPVMRLSPFLAILFGETHREGVPRNQK